MTINGGSANPGPALDGVLTNFLINIHDLEFSKEGAAAQALVRGLSIGLEMPDASHKLLELLHGKMYTYIQPEQQAASEATFMLSVMHAIQEDIRSL